MAAKKKVASTNGAATKTTKKRLKEARTLKEHCERVRKTLVGLYEQSMNASHPVVQGSLREGFIRQVLEGFLGRSASWSSGQIVNIAPKNVLSGQMDLLLHDDILPQIYMYDGVLCLVPHDALFGAIEVKSNLTTDKKGKSVLDQALDSLVEAMKVCGARAPRPAYVIAAFYSGARQATLISKVSAYLTAKNLNHDDYWPDAIVTLSGAKMHPTGIGLFRERLAANAGELVDAKGLNKKLWVVSGGEALGALVALLSKHRVRRATLADNFDFAKYIFSAQAAPAPAGATTCAPPSAPEEQ